MIFSEDHSIVLEYIDTNKLIKLYKKQLDIDVRHYFEGISQLEYREHRESGIRYFFPLIVGNDIFYEQLQKYDWYYQKNKNEYDFVSNFTVNKRILEIGCGEANFYPISNCSNYVGLEFNKAAIEKCKNKGLTVFKRSIADFSEKNLNTFDVVCSFQVLEHVDSPIKFLQDSLKCLKKGGYLIISLPSEDSFIKLAHNNILNIPPHHLTRWTDKSFAWLESQLDAELVQIHHESLDEIHNRWFASTLGREVIRKIFKKKSTKLFDNSLFDKLITKIGGLLGLFLEFGIKNNNKLFIGSSVTVVYRKTN